MQQTKFIATKRSWTKNSENFVIDFTISSDHDEEEYQNNVHSKIQLFVFIARLTSILQMIKSIRESLKQTLKIKSDDEESLHKLSLNLNLQKLQQADQYETILSQVFNEKFLSTIDFQDIEKFDSSKTSETSLSASIMKNMLSLMQSAFITSLFRDDQLKTLLQSRIKDENSVFFVIALSLWCQEVSISRAQYKSLREILRMLKSHDILRRLSETYASLRRQVTDHLSQLLLRRKLLSLTPEKLITISESWKQQTISEQQFMKYLYFFDSTALFIAILRSDLIKKMHIDFEEFRDNSVELWQFNAWTASICTTSDHYAHLQNEELIFSSDFVLYRCQTACLFSQSFSSFSSLCSTNHLEKVVAVSLNYCNDASEDAQEVLHLKIQTALRHDEIFESFHSQIYLRLNDILLTVNYVYLFERCIISIFLQSIILNYSSENKTTDQSALLQHDALRLRFIINEADAIQRLCYSALLQDELKLRIYERQHFVKNFDWQRDNQCLSVSLLMFINDFDLYCNFYRSLMRIYLIIEAFSFHKQARRANVFSLTLESHESNFNEIIKVLTSLRNLNESMLLSLSQSTHVCAFTLCFLRDMPQQQINADFKSQRATLSCWFCLIFAEFRDNLEYDVIKNERFHNTTLQQRREMSVIWTVAKREKFVTQWNLQIKKFALFQLTSALDIIMSRSEDSAHSEYSDLGKQLHHLLLDAILTFESAKKYAQTLRRWPFLSDFARLQSSIHHLKSYSLSKHARWIIIASALLRC